MMEVDVEDLKRFLESKIASLKKRLRSTNISSVLLRQVEPKD
jgi:hypothetical protein